MNTQSKGGSAFPSPGVVMPGGGQQGAYEGMSLRDYFASNAPTDEVQELHYNSLSRIAQERLTGLKYPEKPPYKANDPAQIEFQLAEFEFHCAVNAAIRYKLADAMLKERLK